MIRVATALMRCRVSRTCVVPAPRRLLALCLGGFAHPARCSGCVEHGQNPHASVGRI